MFFQTTSHHRTFRKIVTGSIAGLTALTLLAGCTTGNNPSSRASGGGDAKKAEPAPEFHVSAAPGTMGPSSDSKQEKSSQKNAVATASAEGEDGDAASATTKDGDTVTLPTGERVHVTVSGGTLESVTLTDTGQEGIPADLGTFPAASSDPAASSGPAASSDPASTSESPTADASETANAGGLGTAEPGEEATQEPTGTVDPSAPAPTPSATTPPAPADATEWTSRFDLVSGSSYELKATATTKDGAKHDFTATVESKGKPIGREMKARTVIGDDDTVGVAAPIVVYFGSLVTKNYRDDVEGRLSVVVTDKDGKPREVEGSWGWLYDTDGHSRVHFRPKEHWPEHSKVHVGMPLKNVQMSPTRFGESNLNLNFEVGREQTVVADAKTHRMVVTRGGKTVMDFPASLGAPRSPSYNGPHIVMSKDEYYTMRSQRWNYETNVRYAVRIHNNGEFIHAAPWSAGSQGRANVSHGCVNLSMQRAAEYYKTAIYGDPVEIKGSSVSLSKDDSDISDWVYSWAEWQKLSALS